MPQDISGLYPQAPTPVNPLAVAGSVAQLTGLQNQNRLFSQQFAARNAIGQAYRNSIDPKTGELDTNALLQNVAGDPRAAFMAGDVAAQALERRKNQLEIQTKNFALQLQKANRVSQVLGAHLADPDLSLKGIQDSLADLMTPDESGQVTMPPQQAALEYIAAGTADSQGKLKQHLMQEWLKTADAKTALDAKMGQLTWLQRGGSQVPFSYSAVGGMQQVGPEVANTLSPADRANIGLRAAEPVTYAGPGGAVTMPLGQVAGMRGGGGNAFGVAPQGGAAGQPQMPAAPSLGGYVPYGTQAGAERAGQFSGEAQGEFLKDATGARNRVTQLQQALTALQNTTTGPGTETRNQIVSFLAAAPGIKQLVPDFAVEKVKNFDEAKKLMQQYASATAAKTGVSELSLATALTSNANTSMSQLAASDILKVQMGLERYKMAQARAFNDAGVPASDFQKWSAAWNRGHDPRGFVWDMLPKSAREAALKNMSAADKRALGQTLKEVEGGLLD